MVNVSKSGGIYIEISGDYSKLQDSLNNARVLAKSAGQDISDALSGALAPKEVSRHADNLNKYFVTARSAAQATKADLTAMDKAFRDQGRAIGVAAGDLDKYVRIQRQMYQTQVQKTFTNNLQGIQRLTGATNAEMNRLAKSLGGVGNEFRKASADAGSGIEQITKRLISLSAAYVGIRELSGMASAWTDLTSRVQLATRSQEEARTAMDRIAASANRTYASLDSTAEIFLRNADAFSDLGLSVRQQLDFMESMTDALVVSGAKGQRAEAVINALSKAMMAGALKGENWNTVLQQGGRVVSAMADGLGVSITQLRVMASAGELTSGKMFAALTSQMEKLKAESESMPATIQDAFVKLKNTLTESVGQMDGTLNATTLVVKAIDALGSSTAIVAANIKPLIVTYVAWKVATLATSDAVKAQIALMRSSVAQIGVTQAALKSLTGVAASARAVLGSVVAAAGGPLVLGITAASAAVAYFTTAQSESEKIANRYPAAAQKMREALLGIKDGASQASAELSNISRSMAIVSMERDMEAMRKLRTEIKLFDVGSQSGWGRSDELRRGIEQIGELQEAFRTKKIAAKEFVAQVAAIQVGLQESGDATVKFNSAIAALLEKGINAAVLQAEINKVSESLNTVKDSTKGAGEEFKKAFSLDPSEAQTQVEKLFAKTSEGRRAQLQQALKAAEEYHKVLKSAESAAVLKQARKDLEGFGATGKKAFSAIANEISSTRNKIDSLVLSEETYRQQTLEKKIAEYQRLGASTEDIQRLTVAIKELHAAEDAKAASEELKRQSEENKRVSEQFYKDLQDNAVLGYSDWLAIQNKAIEERSAIFQKAGVDIQDIEKWIAQERLKIARANAVEIEAAYRMSKLESDDGSFEDGLFASIARISEGFKNVATELTDAWGDFFQSFTKGFADSVGRAVVESESLGAALHNVAKSSISSLISSLVQLGIQYVANAALGQTMAAATMAASTAAGVASAGVLAAAYAPAAAAASLASFGSNAAPAMAGMTSTFTLAKTLSTPIGFKEGGYTGNIDTNQIAGVVHGGEYVFNADSVRRIGIQNLEAMQKASESFKPSSGKASVALSKAFSGGDSSSTPTLNVSIENYGTSKAFEVQQLSESEIRIIARDEAQGVTREYAPKVIASQIGNPNSGVSKSFRNNTKLERRR
ncbi:tape measure protein [Desulfococcaceae bacterium OttesenSCG-928-F15]|nr:tape measure protein [Desulfococcaceae bacterium OttesenSCG-928-F15]